MQHLARSQILTNPGYAFAPLSFRSAVGGTRSVRTFLRTLQGAYNPVVLDVADHSGRTKPGGYSTDHSGEGAMENFDDHEANEKNQACSAFIDELMSSTEKANRQVFASAIELLEGQQKLPEQKKADKKEDFPRTVRIYESMKAETEDGKLAEKAFDAAFSKLDAVGKALESGRLKDVKGLFDGIEQTKYATQLLKSLLNEKYGIHVSPKKDGTMDVTYHHEELPIACPMTVTKQLHLAADGTVTATKTTEGGFANITRTQPIDTTAALAELKDKIKGVTK